MKNYWSNEVLLSEILRNVKNEVGDVEDLRLLWKDVRELEKRIVKMGELKCGKNKFKNVDSENVEKLIINIILRWRVIKLGI